MEEGDGEEWDGEEAGGFDRGTDACHLAAPIPRAVTQRLEAKVAHLLIPCTLADHDEASDL